MQSLTRVGILGVGAYAPEEVLTNHDLEKMVDTSDEWITTRTGIKRRHIAPDSVATAELATQAGRRALADAGIGPEVLDQILVSTDTPEMLTPPTACFVQTDLGADRAAALDQSGGCTGFLQTLAFAESRVRTAGETILIIGAELISRYIDWSDRSTCVLFGDGAGAVVVGPSRDEGDSDILASYARTDGTMAYVLYQPAGGTRQPITQELIQQGKHRGIYMEGRVVFKWAVEKMIEAADRVLEQAGLRPEDVDLLIPHQANLRIIDALVERFRFSREKVFINVDEYGNTGAASIPIALEEAVRQEKLLRGQIVLFTAFGAGFSWAGTLLRF